ncbi:MAG: Vms1/Ankzf1 family peptidyl-tRNA hydrolase [Bryobacteraceae bacterium]
MVSLYLNTQPDQHGRDFFGAFVRKEFKERAESFPPRSPERVSFERDSERIQRYLRHELLPSSNGAAIFACSAANDFFEAIQLEAPIEKNELHVYRKPHLYTLARLNDAYRRYAALLVDTNAARLYVFGLKRTIEKREIENVKMSRTDVGGWSQARFQRHVDNFYLQHAKEVVDALDRVVRDEDIEEVIVAGDEVIIPILREQMPKHLNAKVREILRLDMETPEHEVLRATLEALRENEAKDDAERAQRVLGEYLAGGLAAAGPLAVLTALVNGQVDELFLSGGLDRMLPGEQTLEGPAAAAEPVPRAMLPDALVTHAQQTGAKVTFFENSDLLKQVGGVAARLRFRV